MSDQTTADTDHTFTLAAWVNPSRCRYVRLPQFSEHADEPLYPWGAASNQWHGHFMLAKWQSQGQYGDYILAMTPSARVGLGVANNSERFQWDALQSASTLQLNRWTHVAATFHAGNMKLYLDGKLDANKNSPIVQTSRQEYPRDDIHVGSLWNGGYNFQGQLRDICIFKRGLSREEIQRLMSDTR